jgi:hypothetical protein
MQTAPLRAAEDIRTNRSQRGRVNKEPRPAWAGSTGQRNKLDSIVNTLTKTQEEIRQAQAKLTGEHEAIAAETAGGISSSCRSTLVAPQTVLIIRLMPFAGAAVGSGALAQNPEQPPSGKEIARC